MESCSKAGFKLNIISGDLIDLAKNGNFDVIIHGHNCFCTMGPEHVVGNFFEL